MAKVSKDTVQARMQLITYQLWRVPGTTVTIAAAVEPNNNVLATGLSGCIDPNEFDAEMGCQIAISNASKAAEDAIWKEEGAFLRRELESKE